MATTAEQLGALLALSPEPMFVLDQAAGKILQANDAAGSLFGYKASELSGVPVENLVPGFVAKGRGRDYLSDKSRLQALAAGSRLCGLHKSGQEIPIEMSVGTIGERDAAKAICSVHDMSKRFAVEDHLRGQIDTLDRSLRAATGDARRANDVFKLFLKHAPAAIALLDKQMRYLLFSDRWLSDYNLGDRDIHGLSHYDVFPDLPDRWKEIHRRCLAGEMISCEDDTFERADGRVEHLRWALQPWRAADGKIGGLLIYSEMITARKQAEAALLRSNQELELRVAERTAALEELKDHADRANAQKSWFVAAASHDLRQPLQASLAYLSVLMRKIENRELEELCEKSRQPLHAMGDILDVLLDISDLESGHVKPRREDFAISTLIGRIVANAQHHAQEKGLRLSHLPTDFMVYSDPKLLERVITNFVTNAIRYTAKGLIGIYCERRDGKISVSVTDTGIGIPPEAIDSIFDDHVQLSNPARDRRKGLGLGLSIAKRIADSLGHPISVQSELGAGSSFTIELPASEVISLAAPYKAATPDALPLQGDNPIVLLIDDDQDVADAMQMLLQSYDFETYMANGLDSAMEMLDAGLSPGLVVCDYRLPGTNGIEVIRALRDYLRDDVMAILLTGDTGLQVMPSNMENCALLHKPVEVDAFFATLSSLQTPDKPRRAVAS